MSCGGVSTRVLIGVIITGGILPYASVPSKRVEKSPALSVLFAYSRTIGLRIASFLTTNLKFMKAIAFYLSSLEDLEKLKNYNLISDNKEDYGLCVARERFTEIEVCAKRQFPFFYIIGPSGRVAGHGYQNITGKLKTYDPHMNQIDSLSGKELLLRTNDVRNVYGPLSYIEKIGGTPFVSWDDEKRVELWYKVISPLFLKRTIAIFNKEAFTNALYSRTHEITKHSVDGKVFLKSSCKGGVDTAVVNVADILDHVGLSLEVISDDVDIIVSEPLSLLSDSKGKLEYRTFVVSGVVANSSRYLDYDTAYGIPSEVTAFIKEFVAYHKDILPNSYVVDIGIDKKKGSVVIELNPLSASGRYEKNYFDDIIDIIS